MNPIVEKVYQIGIIPVIAFNSVDEALPLCKALAEGGLPAAEVTFRTACADDLSVMWVGIGCPVLSVDEVCPLESFSLVIFHMGIAYELRG